LRIHKTVVVVGERETLSQQQPFFDNLFVALRVDYKVITFNIVDKIQSRAAKNK
jgi:hypothetical protein